MPCADNGWHAIPGTNETHRTLESGLSLYIGPAGKRGPRGVYREGFDHRWTIWHSGTLLGEGFTDNFYAARSAAMQEAERVEWRIKEAIRAMDIRSAPGYASSNPPFVSLGGRECP